MATATGPATGPAAGRVMVDVVRQAAAVVVVAEGTVAAVAAKQQAERRERIKQVRAQHGIGDVVIEGRDVRRWRKATWLTQAEFARRMHLAPQTVCDWESGRCPIPRTHYTALLLVLNRAKAEAAELSSAMSHLNAS